METITISRFKATCFAVLRRVKRTRRPVLITRFGEAFAEIVPPTRPAPATEWLGSMKGRAEIQSDVVRPALPVGAWKSPSR